MVIVNFVLSPNIAEIQWQKAIQFFMFWMGSWIQLNSDQPIIRVELIVSSTILKL